MSHAGTRGIAHVDVTVLAGDALCEEAREVAIEEPLEIRVAGELVATTMRTPGDDHALALGFLYAEGVLHARDDAGSVRHCGRTDDARYGHALDVLPGAGVSLDLEQLARATRSGLTTSACGVCGRDSIDDLRARLSQRPDTSERRAPFPHALLLRAPVLLGAHQPAFARTGGVHAACAIDRDGHVLAHAEDVGRHNAVDKVVGRLLLDGRLEGRTRSAVLLAVSGRASFELVQKAVMAGFCALASISAPSSLAIETARATGLVLAGFVRGEHLTLYAGREHVAR